YATGSTVAFASPSPSLHTAAHEAAHVVQQRGGVQLAGGVGQAGDAYERHADAVADRVVAGASAEDLLDPFAAGSGHAGAAVQMKGEDPDPGGAARPHTDKDKTEQVKLALRAATNAAITAVAGAGRARTPDEMRAALDTGAQLVTRHLRYAEFIFGSTRPADVQKEAIALADALASFSAHATGVQITGADQLHRLGATVEGWAGQPGNATAAPKAGFDSAAAAQGIALNLRSIHSIAEDTVVKIKPIADGDTRPVAVGLAVIGANRVIAELQNIKLLFGSHIDAGRWATYAKDVEIASHALGELIAWCIYMRTDGDLPRNAEAGMKEVRRAVGLSEDGWLGQRPKEEPRPKAEYGAPITTKNFEDAKDKVWLEYMDLGRRQAAGVKELEQTIPKVDKYDPGWFASVVIFLAEVAMQGATGFLGASIAHRLAAAGATAVSRGVNTAVADAIKGGLRQVIHDKMRSHFASQADAAKAFCQGQIESLDGDGYNQQSTFLNQVDGIRQLESRQKGAGIAELELMRHAIAETKETSAKQTQYEASLVEWLKALSQASAGPADKRDPSKGSSPESIADFNDFHAGSLHIPLQIDRANPRAPVKMGGASIRGVNKELVGSLDKINKTIAELKLPVQAYAQNEFAAGMNESQQVWLTVVSGAMGFGRDTSGTYRYLYQHAHDDPPPRGDALKAAAIDGARKIMLDEIAPRKLNELHVHDSGLT
ncbi:MAG TPA: hypothetical protein VFD36_32930, partial [Kofleriaceae bacterium]|nr:hypothetical protein [Kofleriaceae bacterium]